MDTPTETKWAKSAVAARKYALAEADAVDAAASADFARRNAYKANVIERRVGKYNAALAALIAARTALRAALDFEDRQ